MTRQSPQQLRDDLDTTVQGIPRTDLLTAKLGSGTANVASIASFLLYITERQGPGPVSLSGLARLNVLLDITIVAAVLSGIIWSVVQRMLGWKIGEADSESLPAGWSAAVLSLSLTLPIALVPIAYQRLTGITVTAAGHPHAVILIAVLGAGAYLIVFGTSSEAPNGLRQRIMPRGKPAGWGAGLLHELIGSGVYFGLIAFPYRLFVDQSGSIVEAVLGRTLLPWLVFFTGMATFILLKYPESLQDQTWSQVRGVLGTLLLIFCLCGAMYL